jgi:hypothetical protein
MVPLVVTLEVADFESVKFAGALTVVLALPQFAELQELPGVGGLAPPDVSTDA